MSRSTRNQIKHRLIQARASLDKAGAYLMEIAAIYGGAIQDDEVSYPIHYQAAASILEMLQMVDAQVASLAKKV